MRNYTVYESLEEFGKENENSLYEGDETSESYEEFGKFLANTPGKETYVLPNGYVIDFEE